MGRWTQYDDDSYRLPTAVERTGYDADTKTYFFKDRHTGETLVGAPGEEYGALTAVKPGSPERPLFHGQLSSRTDPSRTPTRPTAFTDILAPSQITSPSSALSTPALSPDEKPAPRLLGVVSAATRMARSATVVRRSKSTKDRREDGDSEKTALLRRRATDASSHSRYSSCSGTSFEPSISEKDYSLNEKDADDEREETASSRWDRLSALTAPRRAPSGASTLTYMSGSSAALPSFRESTAVDVKRNDSKADVKRSDSRADVKRADSKADSKAGVEPTRTPDKPQVPEKDRADTPKPAHPTPTPIADMHKRLPSLASLPDSESAYSMASASTTPRSSRVEGKAEGKVPVLA